MRIGIDARTVYYRKAGIGQYILRLIEGLAEVDSQNEYLVLQSRKDNDVLAQKSNFKQASLWTPSHHRLEQLALPLEINPLGLDVLHSPDFIPPFRRNCKSVITIHDLAFLLYPHFLTKESARYYGQIDQAVIRTDHIIAVSEATKQDAVRLLGVPERKITVIHEAASPIYHPLDKEEARRKVGERYGLSGDFILFVSTIEPRKNLLTLLRAYRQLLDDYKAEADLVVAGRKGWLFEEVFALAEKLRLTDRVHFLGRVPVDDLPYLYNAARLFVLPSFYEGFGLPPLEAMACGTPVVVSNVSALPEVVGDAGLLVDPENVSELAVAIWRVLTDEELRAELVEKGLKRAKCFSWKRAAQETLEIYRRLAE
ncbi:MAG: glycosyltransferase family 1 protein [Chloroflexota bacterium]|nr:glycosyltransferase family 1 protein [Chloroflexota bacterium]